MSDQVIVLVAEDDGLQRDLTEEILAEGGFKVAVAESGEQAIEMLDSPGASFRVLVTDIDLGGSVCGWQVARHARELSPAIPVVYTTGKSADDWAANGVPNSVLLTKPFAPAQLLTAVSQLLNATQALPGQPI